MAVCQPVLAAQAPSAPTYSEQAAVLGARQIAQASAHLERVLPGALRDSFELFIYVSKAESGPWAQHLFVFAKERTDSPNPKLIPMGDWPVSTGREQMERAKNGERMSTATPTGFFELDPDRFFPDYHSAQWDRDMPNAMFFDVVNRGFPTGLAIHGVKDADQINALGTRASAGCVQLSMEASRRLFDLVRDNFEGQVPRFVYDEKTRTTANNGDLERDKDGNPIKATGYTALVIIEDYGGAGDPVPPLAVDLRGSAG